MEGVHMAIWEKTIGKQCQEDKLWKCEEFVSGQGEMGAPDLSLELSFKR
jgi:hypothetical protein